MNNKTMSVGELYALVNDGKIKSDIDVQREIVYNDTKQRLVIDSLLVGVPLPAFYFWQNEDGILETLDGKQRIHAISRFMRNDLEFEGKIWMETDSKTQEAIKQVPLTCIICEGDDQLKREIFKRINTLGVPLSPYEVLNGLFSGEYLRGLTSYVSADKGAIKVLGDASRGKRQMKALQYLLLLNGKKPDAINDWVSEHKDESFAVDQRQLDKYIDFVADIFDDMALAGTFFSLAIKYLNDKPLWASHKKEINKAIKAYKKSDDWKLTADKAGDIEAIILAQVGGVSLDPRRVFTENQRAEIFEELESESGRYQCSICKQWFFPDELQIDHIVPWSKGGRTEKSNAQVACRACNIAKSNS